MTTQQLEAIRKHGETLQELFPAVAGMDPVKLCKRLRRLEVIAHNAATRYCNGDLDSEHFEQVQDGMVKQLQGLLGGSGVPVFVNGDARGYALKFDDEWTREHAPKLHRDWGGYGILAPEIDKEGN